MPSSRIDKAYPELGPWSVIAGGQGRCKFVSDQTRPANAISFTQIIKPSAQEAEKYARTIGTGMSNSYDVKSVTALGNAGVAVRQKGGGDMLTLVANRKNTVVMTQMMFQGGVNSAQQATAESLTQETLGMDTGGGIVFPSVKK